MRLSITVPVELVRDNGVVGIVVENQAKHRASFNLDQVADGKGLLRDILEEWAEEQFTTALLKRRRRQTGLKDAAGTPIFEGDIVRLQGHFQEYPILNAAVRWSDEDAAFVLEGRFEDKPAVFQSENLRLATRHYVIGNVFENPDSVFPAVRRPG